MNFMSTEKPIMFNQKTKNCIFFYIYYLLLGAKNQQYLILDVITHRKSHKTPFKINTNCNTPAFFKSKKYSPFFRML